MASGASRNGKTSVLACLLAGFSGVCSPSRGSVVVVPCSAGKSLFSDTVCVASEPCWLSECIAVPSTTRSIRFEGMHPEVMEVAGVFPGDAQCLRALHRRTLLQRNGPCCQIRSEMGENALHPAEGEFGEKAWECDGAGDQGAAAETVRVISFEVWVPVAMVSSVKWIPLTTLNTHQYAHSEGKIAGPKPKEDASSREAVRETGRNSVQSGSVQDATSNDLLEASLISVIKSLGSSATLGSPSERHSDFSLVAGELGVCVGGVYTSLTGFTDVHHGGSVQLAATQKLLERAGRDLSVKFRE